ncbi:uncharacterized protein LOC111713188 [Eurytemora carolleeae]|uniref:uncharacterized protein LOC111713188 n=1 Tax=Eurytemora carolleeae TaxID=1294199 RepID=UPI000C75BD25|nr:uncharacterized protein LOC111713188 [Eurytemora carolleeae]|eukprot:XP_023343778.1 uncharacterized protein LOC111713188 [Eurytemora affinis]
MVYRSILYYNGMFSFFRFKINSFYITDLSIMSVTEKIKSYSLPRRYQTQKCHPPGRILFGTITQSVHQIQTRAPSKPLRVTASYFRASPFFLFHIIFRGISLGLVFSLVPGWVGVITILLLLGSNLFQLIYVCSLSLHQALISSLVSILTPSIFPGRKPLSFDLVAKYQIVNSLVVTGI